MHRTIDIEQLCADKGLRITEQRKVIARVLGESCPTSDSGTVRSVQLYASSPSAASVITISLFAAMEN